ncbi:MAG: hypothetical protein KGR98_03750 [Verrucomicrobia bacterium]|nr:hypothetical protein [Verrucomicrobiota bacterium]MDE3099159.1 hypothetical protein [Verrucomicrobiota bacterium]
MGAILALCLGCCLPAAVGSETYSLADGTTASGDIVTFDGRGVILRIAQDTYSDRISWIKFSQDSLKVLAKNPKVAPFVAPFIEPAAAARRPPSVAIAAVPHLANQPAGSFFGALFSSAVGLVVVLLAYGANIVAGSEIAAFRARPLGMGIGVAAVLPIIGPAVLLSLPTVPVKAAPDELSTAEAASSAEPHRFAVPGVVAPPPPRPPQPRPQPAAPAIAAAGAPEPEQPQEEIQIVAGGFSGEPPPKPHQTEIFQRGQFMFNRRFFETKFAGFFGIARAEGDRSKVLLVKTAGALLTVQRISQVGAGDIHFEVIQGGQVQEVMVPFGDIQQVQVKSKA